MQTSAHLADEKVYHQKTCVHHLSPTGAEAPNNITINNHQLPKTTDVHSYWLSDEETDRAFTVNSPENQSGGVAAERSERQACG